MSEFSYVSYVRSRRQMSATVRRSPMLSAIQLNDMTLLRALECQEKLQKVMTAARRAQHLEDNIDPDRSEPSDDWSVPHRISSVKSLNGIGLEKGRAKWQ